MSTKRFSKALMIGAALLSLSGNATSSFAQEASAEHLDAARAAIRALGATDNFDNILPNSAEQLKATLIQANPNLLDEITAVVDDTAIKIAGRRSDLEVEATSIYAQNFTLEQLKSITEFYNSDAGKALLVTGPKATRSLLNAAQIWSQGIARDLAVESEKTLKETIGQQ